MRLRSVSHCAAGAADRSDRIPLVRLDKCELEPITFEVVVSAKETPMTIDSNSLREELRAWMKSPSKGLPEYSSDPNVQRRVGRMLANFDAKFAPHAKRTSVVNSIRIHPSDKL
jgi:hypothetical protein